MFRKQKLLTTNMLTLKAEADLGMVFMSCSSEFHSTKKIPLLSKKEILFKFKIIG